MGRIKGFAAFMRMPQWHPILWGIPNPAAKRRISAADLYWPQETEPES